MLFLVQEVASVFREERVKALQDLAVFDELEREHSCKSYLVVQRVLVTL